MERSGAIEWWHRYAVAAVPPHVLASAINALPPRQNDESETLGEDAPYGFERHPSVVAITQWWNSGPGKNLPPAGYFKAYHRLGNGMRRVELGGTADLAGFMAYKDMRTATAFVAPNTLLVFHTTQDTDATNADGGIYLPLVNGKGADGESGTPAMYRDGTFDEGYYSVYALREIASRDDRRGVDENH